MINIMASAIGRDQNRAKGIPGNRRCPWGENDGLCISCTFPYSGCQNECLFIAEGASRQFTTGFGPTIAAPNSTHYQVPRVPCWHRRCGHGGFCSSPISDLHNAHVTHWVSMFNGGSEPEENPA